MNCLHYFPVRLYNLGGKRRSQVALWTIVCQAAMREEHTSTEVAQIFRIASAALQRKPFSSSGSSASSTFLEMTNASKAVLLVTAADWTVHWCARSVNLAISWSSLAGWAGCCPTTLVILVPKTEARLGSRGGTGGKLRSVKPSVKP